MKDDSTQESWEELFDEIEVERREYTPDQGMPSPIYEVNSDQMDYVVNTLVRTAIETAIKEERERIAGEVEKRKKNFADLDGECSICGFMFIVHDENHYCEDYNSALTDVLSIINKPQ
jgi:hypothetical protein